MNNQSRYNVLLTYKDYTCAYLNFRGKSAWCKKQATKHCKDVIKEKEAGNLKWYDVKSFEVVPEFS